jgi:drug/metabolite transporter (DMT)-like permease
MGYLTVVIAQVLYSASDAWKKTQLDSGGFSATTLLRPAFLVAVLIGGVGFLFQMHALSKLDLSRTIITMGLLAVIFSVAIGILKFHERFTPLNIVGVAFACIAIILINLK